MQPTTIESIMLTVNSYNTCPYCTGLHGELARMSGLDSDTIDNSSTNSDANDKDDHDNETNVREEVKYAQTFAIESGRGPAMKFAYDNMLNTIGMKHAKSVRALCWALLWGKTTGNSINNARDKLLKKGSGKEKKEKVTSLDIFMLLYYGPLFSIIGVLNKILTDMPSSVPKVISSIIGAVLWLPQAINITPLGIVSLVLNKGVV